MNTYNLAYRIAKEQKKTRAYLLITHRKKMHADATNLYAHARDKLSRPGYTNRDLQQRFNKQRLRKIIAAFHKLPI